jgi:hypothetical protein
VVRRARPAHPSTRADVKSRSISDIDGPDMAQWFYEELLSNETIDADAVAYALDHAVQKLREKMPLDTKQ